MTAESLCESQASLSVVVPLYNEKANIVKLVRCLDESTNGLERRVEFVLVDDGSTDGTGPALAALAQEDPRVRPVWLSRNFGKEAAMSAGLDAAAGDDVVVIDGDLQHPPDLIPRMLELRRQGYDVVNAVKIVNPGESRLYRGAAGLFNVVMSRAMGIDFRGASDFKLMSREVVEAVRRCPERKRFFRGLVHWVGFRSADVPFVVEERHSGATKWKWRQLAWYAIDNIMAYSAAPLRAISVAGLLVTVVAVVLVGQTLWNYYTGQAVEGFTTVIAVELGIGGMVLTSLGVVGLYVANMYEEQKRRPVYITRSAPVVAAADMRGGNAFERTRGRR